MRKRSLVWYAFFLFCFPSELRQRVFPGTASRICLGPFHLGGDKSVGGKTVKCPQSWGKTRWTLCDSTRAESKKVKPQFAR